MKKLFVSSQFSVAHSITSCRIPLHAHCEYVVGYYFRGPSQVLIRSRHYEFLDGDMALLNPGDPHEDFASRQERDYLTVSVRREFLQELVPDLRSSVGQMHFHCSKLEAAAGPMRRICEALQLELDTQELGRETILTSLVTEFTIHLLRYFSPTGSRAQQVSLDPRETHWQIRRALEYLHDNYTHAFSLDRVATAVGLSKFYLERVFKRATGLPLRTYMIMLRLEQAKQQLACSLKPIVEIALELGFSDQSHFTKVFKRFTELTPQAYRRKISTSSNPLVITKNSSPSLLLTELSGLSRRSDQVSKLVPQI